MTVVERLSQLTQSWQPVAAPTAWCHVQTGVVVTFEDAPRHYIAVVDGHRIVKSKTRKFTPKHFVTYVASFIYELYGNVGINPSELIPLLA